MKYFFDTEFNDDGRTIDLISIGIVTQDNRELYAISREAEHERCDPWVRENVLPLLAPATDPAWMTRAEIKQRVLDLIASDPKPEFWAYYADYDWVAFCQLFGRMVDLPKGFPKYCRDLKQLSVHVGSPKHPPAPATKHNALVDARWNRDLFDFLTAHGRATGHMFISL